MSLLTPKRKRINDVNLLGAIRISGSSFFVFKNKEGYLSLKTGRDEKLQKRAVKQMIELNPRVKRILQNYKIKPTIDTKTLKELSGGHMNETCKVAMGIYAELPLSMRSKINEETIKEASMLHDLGKVLIPSKILNKPARLNDKERKIMNIHSTLGYELLKTQNIKSETLDLVKYHHQNMQATGYPLLITGKEPSDIGVQIISTADKYSALREARVYRHKLSRIDSLMILYKEVREGKIHKEVFNALVAYVQKYD